MLDARLAGVVRGAREPMLAQLRLAWWRDRLASDPAQWPKGEPLLARLVDWGDNAAGLVPLVDGWEALLVEPPMPAAAMDQFADGRAQAIAALARQTGETARDHAAAGRRWALGDLALHLGDPAEQACARALLNAQPIDQAKRTMRPLAVLAGLPARALERGSREALDGPGAVLAALRLGFRGH